MAIDASMQLRFMIGLDIVGIRSSNGSIISVKPESNFEHTFRSFKILQLRFIHCIIALHFTVSNEKYLYIFHMEPDIYHKYSSLKM